MPNVPSGPIILDSNVVPQIRSNPTLGGRLNVGDTPVVSNVTAPELRNAVSTGSLRGVPGSLYDLPVINPPTSIHTRINVRGQLRARRGRFGDGVIGAQSIDNGIPLITDDKELRRVINSMGGLAR